MTRKRHIVIVDDEPNIRDLLSTGLSFAGFQVKTVANGAATISAVLEEEPDLIITDPALEPDVASAYVAAGIPLEILSTKEAA